MKTLAFALSLAVAAGAVRAAQEGGDSGFPTVAAADAKAIEKLRSLGALAMPLAANTNVITVDFRAVADQTGDPQLAELKPVSEQLVWLNLAATKVTDAGLAQLATLKHLQRLHLEKTGVTDAGLAHLKALSDLRYLNLYGTKVTDAGLAHLQGLKKLKSLFLWQTGVTDAGAEGLAKSVPGIMINRGWEAEKAKLPPPVEEKKPAAAGKKAINAKCPLTGKDVNPEVTFVYKDQAIGFC
jgi:hypothetical protein